MTLNERPADLIPRAGAAGGAELPRTLGPWSATFAVIGIIVGSGIFRVPGTVVSLVTDRPAIFAVWAVGGVLALCLGLLLAELGSARPQAGGLYVYLRAAFGERAAFLFGWTFLLVNPASWATLAISCTEFISYLYPMEPQARHMLAVALIAALATANCYSTALGAWVQNAATGTKMLALVVLVALVAAAPAAGPAATAPTSAASLRLAPWLSALVAVLWAYDGAASFSSLAGEVRNPRRNVPRALVIGVAAVTALFVAVNAALLHALPLQAIAASPLPLAAAIGRQLGAVGGALVTAAVVVATASSLAGCVLSDPRIFYAMARDGQFFRSIGAVSARRRTPVPAIVLHALLACLYVSVRTFEQLAATFVLGIVPFYALTAAAAWRLRRRTSEVSAPFQAPAIGVLAATWVATAALLVGNALIESPGVALLNIAVTVTGVPVYALWHWLKRLGAGG